MPDDPTFKPLDQVALVVLPAALTVTQTRIADNDRYSALVTNSVMLAYHVATEFLERVNAPKSDGGINKP